MLGQHLSKFLSLVLLAVPAVAQTDDWTYSPLTARAVAPRASAPLKISVEPDGCPASAVVVRASSPVAEEDFQGVRLELTVPPGLVIGKVEVCYSLKSAKKGGTYISQTRLIDMTDPAAAQVRMEDRKDRKKTGPRCYVKRVGFRPRGTVTLELKVVFADAADEIRIGMVKLRHGRVRTNWADYLI